ncbi:hypothetical protein PNOK_0157800 [Pyrrhoderma noxium]|uniref:Uncharacterized protein n=1 Tax=Pyrrhoderma noxium TaxID=2282107 RepID=A0A286UPU0_9AGAM|nr:hypothetical protein PNOK_0157800 [Pyrrhoderma noxium]
MGYCDTTQLENSVIHLVLREEPSDDSGRNSTTSSKANSQMRTPSSTSISCPNGEKRRREKKVHSMSERSRGQNKKCGSDGNSTRDVGSTIVNAATTTNSHPMHLREDRSKKLKARKREDTPPLVDPTRERNTNDRATKKRCKVDGSISGDRESAPIHSRTSMDGISEDIRASNEPSLRPAHRCGKSTLRTQIGSIKAGNGGNGGNGSSANGVCGAAGHTYVNFDYFSQSGGSSSTTNATNGTSTQDDAFHKTMSKLRGNLSGDFSIDTLKTGGEGPTGRTRMTSHKNVTG